MNSAPSDLLSIFGDDPLGAQSAVSSAGVAAWQVVVDALGNPIAHWPLVIPLVVLVLGMMGLIGKGAGLFHLFRDDDEVFGGTPSRFAAQKLPVGIHRFTASPAFWSGFGLAITTGLVWMVMHTGAPRAGSGSFQILGPGGEIRIRGLVALSLVLLGTVTISRTIVVRYMRLPRSDLQCWQPERQTAEIRRTTAGGLAGAIMVVVILALSILLTRMLAEPVWLRWLLGATENWPVQPLVWIALPYLALVAIVFLRTNALAVVPIFCLVILLVLALGLASRLAGVTGEVAVGLGLIWIWWANGWPGKYRLPGFEELYDRPEEPLSEKAGRHGDMIDPVSALSAWKASVASQGEKPILVIVATSGGAYRATFWTSLILDRLNADSAVGGRWPGLVPSIRLVTGASGGMVAGAYLVVLARENELSEGITHRIITDTRASLAEQCGRLYPIGRDSLSPLIHQMVRRDLWQPFRFSVPKSDRGRVLQSQWRTLDTSFAALRTAEADGRIPSIIFSPMVVETGAVALLSNLSLEAIRKRAAPPGEEMAASVEIFRTFAGTQDNVNLATAVRLSATFPYMSPAVSLPTTSDRRLVDAGYYDNYGVDLATGYLDEESVRGWIIENCGGVAVIETRAFPAQRLVHPPTRFRRAFQFLTSPLEGLLNARQASQIFRNTQQLNAVRDVFGQATGDRDFLKVFTFEAVCDVSMSWYLRLDEIEALAAQLTPPDHTDRIWLAAYFQGRGEDEHIAALQRNDMEAFRARGIRQRKKVADTLEEMEAFWRRE